MRIVQYDIVGQDESAEVGRIYTGDCDNPIRVWFPDATRALKKRYNPYFESTDEAIKKCKSFPAGKRAEWDLFIASWRELMQDDPGLTTASPQAGLTCGMVFQLESWREEVEKICGGLGPDPKPPSENPLSVVKTVAIAAAVIAGALVVISFTPQIKALLPGSK